MGQLADKVFILLG